MSIRRFTLTPLVLILTLAAASGCDDAESTPDATSDSGQDVVDTGVDSDVGDDAEGDVADVPLPDVTSFELVVETPADEDDETIPIEGALVAFDPPEGDRVEDVTDDEGRVLIEDIDWSSDTTASLTVYVDGSPMQSFTGLTETNVARALGDDGALHMSFAAISEPPTTYRLYGQAQNMDDDGNSITVTADMSGSTQHQAVGPDWELSIPAETPYRLVATEWNGGTWNGRIFTQNMISWTEVSGAAITEDTEVTIDFDDELESTNVSGTLLYPDYGDTSFFADALSYMLIYSLESNLTLFYGAPTRFDPISNVDGTAFEFNHAELSDATPVTMYRVYVNASAGASTQSFVLAVGPPESGTQIIPFPEPPVLVSPTDEAIGPGGTVSWTVNETDGADETLFRQVVISSAGVPRVLHAVFVAHGNTSTVIPEPPTGVDPTDLYGSVAAGNVRLCGQSEGELSRWCSRYATSGFFSFEP